MTQFEKSKEADKAPKGQLEINLEDFPPTPWAGRPAEYKKFQLMWCAGKKVIIDHYYASKGVYIVSEMMDHPGMMKTYPVSPDQLQPGDEELRG